MNHIAKTPTETYCGAGETEALYCSTSPELASCPDCITNHQEDRMTSQTPASTSDARKRKAEREPDQPPTLPDTSGWVRREPGDVIEAGTPYVSASDEVAGGHCAQWGLNGRNYDWTVGASRTWTPPPAHAPVWSVISTDRDQPTLARVTWKNGDTGGEFTAAVYVAAPVSPDHRVVMLHNGFDAQLVVGGDVVTDVELLHTYDPETHVPVPRALVDEAVGLVREQAGRALWDSRRACKILSNLAALADEKGAES